MRQPRLRRVRKARPAPKAAPKGRPVKGSQLQKWALVQRQLRGRVWVTARRASPKLAATDRETRGRASRLTWFGKPTASTVADWKSDVGAWNQAWDVASKQSRWLHGVGVLVLLLQAVVSVVVRSFELSLSMLFA